MATEVGIVDKIVALHDALDAARLPHAFGGALALAWCTQRARGTIDIDLNVFVSSERFADVLNALPAEVRWTTDDLALGREDGQVRVWWEATHRPVHQHHRLPSRRGRSLSRARLRVAQSAVPELQ